MKYYALCVWSHAYSRAPIGSVQLNAWYIFNMILLSSFLLWTFAAIPTDLCILLILCKYTCMCHTIWFNFDPYRLAKAILMMHQKSNVKLK